MSDRSWHIHRRTFLRGVGAAMALPMLDAMAPSLASVVSAATATPANLPKRMAFVYVPNGVTKAEWTPEGDAFEFKRILEPLNKHKQDISVLTGIAQ
jgi:hypothetical protein